MPPEPEEEEETTEQTPEEIETETPEVKPPVAAAKPTSKVVAMPTGALAEIKQKARARGRALALVELNERARKAGFASLEDMEKAALRTKQRPTGARTTTREEETVPAKPDAESAKHPRYLKKLEKERDQLLARSREQNRARAAEERRRKDAEKRIAALEAEKALERAALRAGVTDVDYALELLRRKLNGKTAAELSSFDENTFFSGELRESHPYLYGVEERPASTGAPEGTKGTPAPKAPQTAAPRESNGDSSALDARKLSNEEYTKLLQKRGLVDPRQGL